MRLHLTSLHVTLRNDHVMSRREVKVQRSFTERISFARDQLSIYAIDGHRTTVDARHIGIIHDIPLAVDVKAPLRRWNLRFDFRLALVHGNRDRFAQTWKDKT